MVLVKVKAASINPIDYKIIAGYLADMGWPFPTPFTPGYDFSGTIHEVGEDVKDFSVGDDVFACNWGSNKDTHLNSHADEGLPIAGAFAEYCLIPESKISKKPEAVSHEEAAAIALVGLTALQSVNTALNGSYMG